MHVNSYSDFFRFSQSARAKTDSATGNKPAALLQHVGKHFSLVSTDAETKREIKDLNPSVDKRGT